MKHNLTIVGMPAVRAPQPEPEAPFMLRPRAADAWSRYQPQAVIIPPPRKRSPTVRVPQAPPVPSIHAPATTVQLVAFTVVCALITAAYLVLL